jgi:hypothetical protein
VSAAKTPLFAHLAIEPGCERADAEAMIDDLRSIAIRVIAPFGS